MALSSPILRKLRLFKNGLLLQMSKKCKHSLVSATVMVTLCAMAAPFYTLLCKEITCYLTNTEDSAMLSLCSALCSHLVLALPDFTKPFCIENNIFDTTIGGVFTQMHASIHKSIAFSRKTLTNSE